MEGRRSARYRAASAVALVAVLLLWQLRSTGGVSASAFALTVGLVATCAIFGRSLARLAEPLVGALPGFACEFVLGFFVCNTALFVLELASPLGIAVHVAGIGVVALLWGVRSARRAGSRPAVRAEAASFACIVFCAVVATLWVHDQQPVVTLAGDQSIFDVWYDVFIHARVISTFAQSHGLSTIQDIKLAGLVAPVYHFGSYMVPAAFNALTATSATDAYVAFQLPFGILLVGLAAYSLAAVCFRSPWIAFAAAAGVVALPDTVGQGLDIRYLSFHFMSQVNLGMLYGIACAALAWLFMIEACRRGRVAGLAVAYLLLAVLVVYKAHVFVANALVLMLYPCLLFHRRRGRIAPVWRAVAAVVLLAVFVAVIVVSQWSPRVPTIRLDGSGIGRYIDILMGGWHDGPLKRTFNAVYDDPTGPKGVRAVLAAAFIAVMTFGVWLAVAPLAGWTARRSIDVEVAVFVGMVVVNYMLMSLGLALDERWIGTPEEFVNRPAAWAYFVVALFGTSAVCLSARSLVQRHGGSARWRWPVAGAFGSALVGLLAGVHGQASGLQTFPESGGHATYAEFNGVPTCLVQAARYIHDHAAPGDVLQDAAYDPDFHVTALAERQGYVAEGGFGGRSDIVKQRIAALRAVQQDGTSASLRRWAAEHRVRWYVAHPEDRVGAAASAAEDVVYRCGGFSVLQFGR